jgi:transposase
MEACGGSHFLGRALREQGHEVRLIPAQYVKPCVKTNKSDYIDAEAIAEAVGRPTMRFVPVKSDDQLDLQSLHRARERWVMRRTAVVNQVRGLLLERGTTLRKGRRYLDEALPSILASGRDFAAWLGVVPEEHSTGGKQTLWKIPKRGNQYLRRLFVQGARAVMQHRTKQSSGLSAWLAQLTARTHQNIAIVALANKLARMAWAVLAKNEVYKPPILASDTI